jgi:phosphosulfolactate synthase
MEVTSHLNWHPLLVDPTGRRNDKPRTTGKTMVIDKGLGLSAFEDLLQTAGNYIDMIKIGFGTSPLYPQTILQKKIELAKAHHICILPGGTFLEVAVTQNAVESFFKMIEKIGFTGLEVSDGTIELSRKTRTQLIARGLQSDLRVFTEYGKKFWGSSIEINELIDTIHLDVELGAELVTIEGRESGAGVGIFDENGDCKEDDIAQVVDGVSNQNLIMWETPHKSQQVHLIKSLGAHINLGNIAPGDVLSLESLRRGLRSDTMSLTPTKINA